jgi:hypothetical protein
MVVLASAVRACGRARATYAPLAIPAQLVLLLAWAATRVLFLALENAATKIYLADIGLRRRWTALD